ncbi:hypothetical protein [Pseudomonas moraviensis]|uniref:Prophage PssSM-03 n=1 Tax=Pseudomonas moraviensis R28-S TaxID=1395516 RepID=V8RAP2_9PSED|nr:hypothetical protein [Pseudomonas moraviensis]ETF08354.1 hypothetical protein PMO01_05025 [Pseudomonas moraviensis R28-S]
MMKKQHGPAFVRCLIPMTECPSCHGAGLIQGLFHQLECIGCHSSGLVHSETLEPLRMDDLVVQLGLRVRNLTAQLKTLDCSAPSAEARHYQQDNTRGAGRTTFRGD